MGRPFIDITGQTFGKLTVIERAVDDSRPAAHWRCRCLCGKETIVNGSRLRNGITVSCGCYLAESKRTHGHCPHNAPPSPTYRSWQAMITRCHNPKYPQRYLYADRGITVCERWRNSFENFLEDMGEKPTGLSIDRINNDGNYEPGNCRWATWSEQQLNRRPWGHKLKKNKQGQVVGKVSEQTAEARRRGLLK